MLVYVLSSFFSSFFFSVSAIHGFECGAFSNCNIVNMVTEVLMNQPGVHLTIMMTWIRCGVLTPRYCVLYSSFNLLIFS